MPAHAAHAPAEGPSMFAAACLTRRKRTLRSTSIVLLLSCLGVVAATLRGCAVIEPADMGYVGSANCLTCHATRDPGIVKQWGASRHHLGMRAIAENQKIGARTGKAAAVKREDIVAIIGPEDGECVYIRRDHRVFPSARWDAEEAAVPHDVIGAGDKPADASRRCFGCHSTGYSLSSKTFVEPGVGCEACHGPGKAHVRSGGAHGTIVNPALLSADRNRMVCGQCHSVGTDPTGKHPFPVMKEDGHTRPFKPGDDLTAGFRDARPILVRKSWEYSLFVQSTESYAKQLCTDCHDPHGKSANPSMLLDATSEICLRCHGIGNQRLRFKNHWGLGDAIKRRCWECHPNAHSH